MAYIPETNSVVAFQSDPTKLLTHSSVSGTLNIAGNPSISGTVNIGTMPGSVAAWLNSSNASVITVGSPVANQSVSGSVGIVGNPSISGDVRIIGSVNAVIIGGSIAATFTPPANQSVSGSVGVVGNPSISGTVQIGNFPTTQNVSGSVAAWLNSSDASIITVGSPVANQSVSGSVGIVGNPSISGTVQVGNFPTTQNVSGSVVAFGFPTNQNVSGSVVAFVNGTVPVNAAGSVVAFQGTPPWAVNVGGSVITVAKDSSVIAVITSKPSISGTVDIGNTNVNVSGSVVAFVSGTVPVNAAGSVVAFQGTSPWVVNFQNSSVLAVPVGSVITIEKAPSIVGTYAEDVAHTSAEKGIFVLGVRNDTVASFTSSNTDYGPQATDSAGRLLTKPFSPEESRIEGYISLTSTSVTTLVAAAGAGLRNYITDLWFANTGAATTLVTFKDGAGSILGYTIAPTTGGSNLPGLQTPIRTGANATFDVQAATATSTLYATVKGFKAP